MTYPDGEVVTYHYNGAGQIESLSSNKMGKENVIVDEIGYDKDGHTFELNSKVVRKKYLHIRQ